MAFNNDRKVLHVDDDAAITAMMCNRLSGQGYELHGLHDSRAAVDMLLQNDFRVVLLDIDMPHIDGLTLLRTIKEHDGGIQVLMLTGLVNMTTALEALRGGAEACFFKPVDDIQPIVNSLDDVFRKVDRWWTTLNDLSHRKKLETCPPEIV